MQKQGSHFIPFIKKEKIFLWIALIIAIAYFIIVRLLYPIPSFFSDSFTFVGAASANQPVSFRPIMYSKLIQFFKLFSASDVALIAAQYFSSVLANLFLFFTSCWLFQLKRWYKYTLFALLICHPFYVFSSNYVSSDAFFTSCSVLWFTLLLWIMYKPKWYIITVHIALLVLLFMLRYNAIYYPVFTALAILFTRLAWFKKLAAIAAAFILIAACIEVTTRKTKSFAKTSVFSPFSGWQLANNALHIVRNQHIDTSTINDQNVKKILIYNQHYFDTAKSSVPPKGGSWYMWHPDGPLKKYTKVYDPKQGYFTTWVALGPVYGKFGKTIILQNPGGYLRHFVLPNAGEYFYPSLEVYATYMEGLDTVATVAQKYFKYESIKAPIQRPALYAAVFAPWPFLFTCSNLLLFLFGTWYFFSRQFKAYSRLINRFILLFACYFIANFFFIVLLAPSVFRYHLPVLLLSMPGILFFISVRQHTIRANIT